LGFINYLGLLRVTSVDILNERFGTDFTRADQLFFDQMEQEAADNEVLRRAARVNSMADFLDIFGRLMGDEEFRDLAQDSLGQKVYQALVKSGIRT